MLNDKQFGNKVLYHGTTEEAADAISREGFSLGHERHGRSGGSGVYLTSKPEVAREFGPAVVEVSLRKGTKINRGDSFAALLPPLNKHFKAATAADPNLSLDQFWVNHSQSEGFGGHKDDDGSIIVYDPKNVGYRSHKMVGMVDDKTAAEQFEKRSGL
jgi:hypothetical protein